MHRRGSVAARMPPCHHATCDNNTLTSHCTQPFIGSWKINCGVFNPSAMSCASLVLLDSKTFIEAFEAENFHFGSGILWLNWNWDDSTLPLSCSITSLSEMCAVIRHLRRGSFPRVQRGEERSWPQCPLHCCGGSCSCSGDSCRRSCLMCTVTWQPSCMQLAAGLACRDSSLIVFSADISTNHSFDISMNVGVNCLISRKNCAN